MTSSLPSLIDTVKALDATARIAVPTLVPWDAAHFEQEGYLPEVADFMAAALNAAPRLAIEVETMAELLKQVGNANTKEALFAAKDAVRAFMVKR